MKKVSDIVRSMSRGRLERYAGMAMLALVVGLAYKGTFAWLAHIWWTDKEHSHGFLVPLISVYLIWRTRLFLASRKAKPQAIIGGGIVLFAVVLLAAGRAGGVVLAEAVSFLVLLPGLALFVWGWETLMAIALPLAYLQFMVPWTEEFVDWAHHPFQLFSAWLGAALMRAAGVPAYLDGLYISLPNLTLEVARECSGVRFLTSVIALGLPLVYVTQTRWSRALGVLLSGVVITILANSLRIALGGTMAYRYSPALLHGPLHVLQGWFAAQIGFVALVFVNWLVARRSEAGSTVLSDSWKSVGRAEPSAGAPANDSRMPRAAAFAFLCAIFLVAGWYAEPVPVPRERASRPIPGVIGRWRGSDQNWIRGEEYFPGADFHVARRYADGNGSEIFFYSGYFSVQRHGKSVVSFRERPLHIAAVQLETRLTRGPGRIESTEVAIGGRQFKVFLWYRLGSRYVTGRYAMKAWTTWDSLLHRRNNAAVYIVAIPIPGRGHPGDWEDAKSFSEFLIDIVEVSPV